MDPETVPDLTAAHDPEALHLSESCVCRFPDALTIEPGQSHPHILLAKAMLRCLSREFPEFSCSPSGDTLDEATALDLRHLQHCSGLPETGALDRRTWNRLCRLYRAVFDRFHAPSQG